MYSIKTLHCVFHDFMIDLCLGLLRLSKGLHRLMLRPDCRPPLVPCVSYWVFGRLAEAMQASEPVKETNFQHKTF